MESRRCWDSLGTLHSKARTAPPTKAQGQKIAGNWTPKNHLTELPKQDAEAKVAECQAAIDTAKAALDIATEEHTAAKDTTKESKQALKEAPTLRREGKTCGSRAKVFAVEE
jgi:hypothetical protein